MKCSDCRFSSASSEKIVGCRDGFYVECRFNPPVVVHKPDFDEEDDWVPADMASLFPVLRGSEWCGKFEPKPE